MPYKPKTRQAPAVKFGPFKGAHLDLNEDVLAFIGKALQDIQACYTDDRHDEDPGAIVNALEAGYGLDDDGTQDQTLRLQLKWQSEEDKFGYKVYAAEPYAVNGHEQGELRVTVVLKNNRGAESLHLDIRVWGEYSSDASRNYQR